MGTSFKFLLRMAVQGQAGQWQGAARLGGARLDTLRGGIPAAVGPCRVWLGEAGKGMAWLHTRHLTGCRSVASQGKARLGRARRGYTHCILRGAEVWLCAAWLGTAGRGMARQTHSIPTGVLKFAGNTNNERKTQWKTQ